MPSPFPRAVDESRSPRMIGRIGFRANTPEWPCESGRAKTCRLGCVWERRRDAQLREGISQPISELGQVRARIGVARDPEVEPSRVGERPDRARLSRSSGPHYRVRWDDGHESVLIPTAGNARIVPAAKRRAG